jgi:hypothetical protein
VCPNVLACHLGRRYFFRLVLEWAVSIDTDIWEAGFVISFYCALIVTGNKTDSQIVRWTGTSVQRLCNAARRIVKVRYLVLGVGGGIIDILGSRIPCVDSNFCWVGKRLPDSWNTVMASVVLDYSSSVGIVVCCELYRSVIAFRSPAGGPSPQGNYTEPPVGQVSANFCG